MAYYCGECALWQGSSDSNKYGERWCPYSRHYEKSDQNTYGCRGFVYAERAVLTKVCEILELPKDEYFEAFDVVKEKYVVKNCMCELVSYSALGPKLAEMIDRDENKYAWAKELYEKYIAKAKEAYNAGMFVNAYSQFKDMVFELRTRYEY